MTRVTVAKWGNSLALRLPKHVADDLGLTSGTAMAAGREQTGPRYAIVLSPKAYNRKAGLAACCPITS